jgi:hypothetical protein
MKNIMKLMFVLISSFAIISSVNAGELSVTGSAKASYNISSTDSDTGGNDRGKAIGLSNEITFVGTGELDNGMSWKWQTEMDPAAGGATTSDDTQLVLTTDFGTIGIMTSEGNLSTKYKHAGSAYGIGSDNGYGGGITYGNGLNGYNNIQFKTAADALPLGMSVAVGYAPGQQASQMAHGMANPGANGGVKNNNVVSYQVMAAPMDGLSIGASYLKDDDDADTKQEDESGGYFAKYSMGAFSVGYNKNYYAPGSTAFTTVASGTALSSTTLKAVEFFENDALSIGFAVNDNLSLSYDIEKSEANKRTITKANAAHTDNAVELEITSIQAAYTIGGATLAITHEEYENDAYALGKDNKETIFTMAMAF